MVSLLNIEMQALEEGKVARTEDFPIDPKPQAAGVRLPEKLQS